MIKIVLQLKEKDDTEKGIIFYEAIRTYQDGPFYCIVKANGIETVKYPVERIEKVVEEIPEEEISKSKY